MTFQVKMSGGKLVTVSWTEAQQQQQRVRTSAPLISRPGCAMALFLPQAVFLSLFLSSSSSEASRVTHDTGTPRTPEPPPRKVTTRMVQHVSSAQVNNDDYNNDDDDNKVVMESVVEPVKLEAATTLHVQTAAKLWRETRADYTLQVLRQRHCLRHCLWLAHAFKKQNKNTGVSCRLRPNFFHCDKWPVGGDIVRASSCSS